MFPIILVQTHTGTIEVFRKILNAYGENTVGKLHASDTYFCFHSHIV